MSVKKIKAARFVRKWHRRLGIIFGIQLMLWTLGGIYFSWFHIDNVHGDYERSFKENLLDPNSAGTIDLEKIINFSKFTKIREISAGKFLHRTVVRVFGNKEETEMFDAETMMKLSPIKKDDAILLAKEDFTPEAQIRSVTYIGSKGGEYKGPVPAYKISFSNSKKTNIYVSINEGKVTARRNSIWRGFDFLWMFHIMDYQNRENFNNWLLRIGSILALLTIVSGYILWFIRKKI